MLFPLPPSLPRKQPSCFRINAAALSGRPPPALFSGLPIRESPIRQPFVFETRPHRMHLLPRPPRPHMWRTLGVVWGHLRRAPTPRFRLCPLAPDPFLSQALAVERAAAASRSPTTNYTLSRSAALLPFAVPALHLTVVRPSPTFPDLGPRPFRHCPFLFWRSHGAAVPHPWALLPRAPVPCRAGKLPPLPTRVMPYSVFRLSRACSASVLRLTPRTLHHHHPSIHCPPLMLHLANHHFPFRSPTPPLRTAPRCSLSQHCTCVPPVCTPLALAAHPPPP